MDEVDIKPMLESVLFVAGTPIRLETLIEVLPDVGEEALRKGIEQIQADCREGSRGIELTEVAGGYQFRTKPHWAEWVNRLKKVKAVKLSRSALETLAIIAYRQPVIRPEIEQIRGADSGWVLRTLMEKGLVKMMGRKDLPGRPMIYGTTKAFLELFGLNTISDLPSLKEVMPPPVDGEAQRMEDEAIPIPPGSTLVESEIEDVLDEIDHSGDEDAF
jgi:segregation and condensation protein B